MAAEHIESLDGPADPAVQAAWNTEIERRAAAYERGEVKLIPGGEVFTRLRRRLASQFDK